MSEGAEIAGDGAVEGGSADAYGHRKLGGVGARTADLLKNITGQDTMYQQLSYLMRSGAPDCLDLMVARNYANMAVGLIDRGESSLMVALVDGNYTTVPLSTIASGIKRVNVDELYDPDDYRPKIRHVEGQPMFLR